MVFKNFGESGILFPMAKLYITIIFFGVSTYIIAYKTQ